MWRLIPERRIVSIARARDTFHVLQPMVRCRNANESRARQSKAARFAKIAWAASSLSVDA